MKNHYLSLSASCLLVGLTTSAQAVTVFVEDFEDADYTSLYGNSYTQSHADASDFGFSAGEDYFGRVDPVDGITIVTDLAFTNQQGTGFFAGQDINHATLSQDPNVQSTATLNWTGIDITNYTNLSFSMFAAVGNNGHWWDANDSISISYQIDGGGFSSIYGIENTDNFNSLQAGIDRNNDGVSNEATGNGELLTNAFAQFGENIAGTGSSLDLTITIAAGGFTSNDDDFAFDNVEISGDLVPEPSSTSLLGLGGLALILRRRR